MSLLITATKKSITRAMITIMMTTTLTQAVDIPSAIFRSIISHDADVSDRSDVPVT